MVTLHLSFTNVSVYFKKKKRLKLKIIPGNLDYVIEYRHNFTYK